MNQQEDILHVQNLFRQTRDELAFLTKIVQRLEIAFRRDPTNEGIQEDMSEIFETIQQLNGCIVSNNDVAMSENLL